MKSNMPAEDRDVQDRTAQHSTAQHSTAHTGAIVGVRGGVRGEERTGTAKHTRGPLEGSGEGGDGQGEGEWTGSCEGVVRDDAWAQKRAGDRGRGTTAGARKGKGGGKRRGEGGGGRGQRTGRGGRRLRPVVHHGDRFFLGRRRLRQRTWARQEQPVGGHMVQQLSRSERKIQGRPLIGLGAPWR
jgi:hypothetical protein